MSAKDKHEITAPLTSPTPTSLPSSHTFEASTCSEVCTGHKHASGDLLQVTSYKASSLKPPATSGLKPSAQVLSSNPFTSQTPTTFQDPQTLVSKTAEVTKLEHPFRNTAEAITPLSSGDLASFFTPSFDYKVGLMTESSNVTRTDDYKTQATSLPTCSLDHPAQGLDSQVRLTLESLKLLQLTTTALHSRIGVSTEHKAFKDYQRPSIATEDFLL